MSWLGLSVDLLRQKGAAADEPLFDAGEAGAWYDPSDLASMFQDSATTVAAAVDAPVGYIADKSGNGNHAVQAASGSRPVLRQSGALYYLDFGSDGGTDDGIGKAFPLAQPWERVSAVRQINWASLRRILGDYSTVNGQLYQSGASPAIKAQSGLTTGPTSSAVTLGSDFVLTERHNGAASALAINAGADVVTDAGTGAANGVMIGNRAALNAGGRIRCYGLLVRQGTMTAGQLAAARAWMAARAGLSL